MNRMTVAEHLERMQEGNSPTWLIDLGETLQEIEGLDSALAASLVYDLARDQKTARAFISSSRDIKPSRPCFRLIS